MLKIGTLICMGILIGTNALAADQLLEKPIEVRISQAGFAGVTEDVYSVDVLGNWDAVTMLGDQNVSEPRSGVLPPEQIAELTALLGADLSSATVEGIDINPKTVEVKYDDSTYILALPGGADFSSDGPQEAPGKGLRELALWFESTIGYE